MNLKNIIFLILILSLNICRSQVIQFTYDANGNRVLKKIVSNIPDITISGDSIYCKNEVIDLFCNQGNYSLLWNTGATQHDIHLFADTTRLFAVYATNNSNHACTDSAFKWVVVNPLPTIIPVSGDSLVLRNTTHPYQVDTSSNAIFIWSVTKGNITGGDSTNQVNIKWDNVTLLDSGIITVRKIVNGCSSPSVSYKVIITNPDGINDISGDGLSLYPNPSSDGVYANFTGTSEGLNSVRIFTPLGIETYSELNHTDRSNSVMYFDSSHFKVPGLYTIVFYYDSKTISKNALIIH